MTQTIKFAVVRAASDPDRTTHTDGRYKGHNLTRHASWRARADVRVTHAAWLRQAAL